MDHSGIIRTFQRIYCTTEGAFGNNYTTVGSNISISGYSKVSGKSLENPSGGANQKSTLAYKNSTAGSFGTYGSAVTKSQYQAIVNTYPSATRKKSWRCKANERHYCNWHYYISLE